MDLYRILGITRDSDPSQIKQAYYDMAKRYHPDSSNHTDNKDPHMSSACSMSQEKKKERFQQVQMAYEILSCEQKR